MHNNPLRFVDPSGHKVVEGAGAFFAGTYEELMLHWSDVAATYADAHNIADYGDAVDIVVPEEHRAEVKTIVYQNGAARTNRTAGDVPSLGLAAPVAGAAAGAIKNTTKTATIKATQSAKNTTTLWDIKTTADKKISYRFGGQNVDAYRDPKTGYWWAKDTTGHGNSAYKVFKEAKGGKELHWVADADEYGNFILDKHKSSTGTIIKIK